MIACHKKLCAMIASLDKNLSNFFLPLDHLSVSTDRVDPRRTLDFMVLHQTFHKAYPVESVQDLLIKLDFKPKMHLSEISTFSLNIVIIRLTKIMKRADKIWANF